jgi:hypothetical protein
MKKTALAITLIALTAAGLTACDPPMPDELKVLEAEKKHVCVDGNSFATAPAALAGVVKDWSTSLTETCAGTTVETSSSKTAPNVSLSTSKTEGPCPNGYSFPLLADSGVITYSIPDVSDMTLSFKTLAKIFSGEITDWSSDEIAAENPDTQLPTLPIVLNPIADKRSLDALVAWGQSKNVKLETTAFKPTDASFTPKTSAGSISILSLSQALTLAAPVVSVIVGASDDGTPITAVPDETGAYEGASQWVVSSSANGVSVTTDYKAAPSAPPGFDIAPSYQAAFPIMGVLCPSKLEQTQAVAYSWLRTDYQGTTGDSHYMALPTKVRAKTFIAVGKGLPAGK